MYLVDTSVWVEFLRKSGTPEIQERLRPIIREDQAALTDWIILELMTGLRSAEKPSSLLKRLEPVSRLPFPDGGWKSAWDLAASLRKRGVTPSAADCFLATIAIHHSVELLHCDVDFEHIAEHCALKTVNWIKLLR
ncbi:MAG: PIN domain-containing protein [Planctomycetes bacterium]|nr:PIN domain-containing protein [Planctomycetota bacterium]